VRKNLKNQRLAMGLTQKTLGDRIGLSGKLICALECGRIRGSVDTWDRLELVLGVDQRVLRLPDEASPLEALDKRLD
jgi:transcriptional regulator with XRE-family HTH domain